MRFRTLEIRWHDSKPISSCDFQPVQFKKARPQPPASEKDREDGKRSGWGSKAEWASAWASQSYRLATAGEDNHVRLWMVYPNINPLILSPLQPSASQNQPQTRPPRVEYLATLSRHSSAVNVVRWSPNGELLASAGDDGMVIIWAQSTAHLASNGGSTPIVFGQDPVEESYEKEYWKPRVIFRCTSMQVYDLAWSPTGEYVLTGSTDNVARVYQAADGHCVHEVTEHNHFVQGVAWDPLNEYIATQSSDRSMHVYKFTTHNRFGAFEAHAVGRNTSMHVRGRRHARTSSTVSMDREKEKERETSRPATFRREGTVSDIDNESVFDDKDTTFSLPPLPPFPPSSRRSSFSNASNAPSSPAPSISSRLRSPSPMPALPAIRTTPASFNTISLYGDESFTSFFRRLSFSPDGGLLVTPAGLVEDPEFIPQSFTPSTPSSDRGRKLTNPNDSKDGSCVYVYNRANLGKPPIAQLPGYTKPSIAVRFCPILWETRQNVNAPVFVHGTFAPTENYLSPLLPSNSPSGGASSAPPSIFSTPTGTRLLFSVLTTSSIHIYDTQQSTPLALLTKLHYDEFTDVTWSPDGQCLLASSRDGYCSIVVFDEVEGYEEGDNNDVLVPHHTQQQALQLKSIAQQHSMPITSASPTPSTHSQSVPATPTITPALSLPTPVATPGFSIPPKREHSPVPEEANVAEDPKKGEKEPPKKKRRMVLTRIGDLEP